MKLFHFVLCCLSPVLKCFSLGCSLLAQRRSALYLKHEIFRTLKRDLCAEGSDFPPRPALSLCPLQDRFGHKQSITVIHC